MLNLELAWNSTAISYGRYFTEKKIIAKSLSSKFSDDEKQEVLTWKNTSLNQVKSYIDNDINHVKVNVIDMNKGNITEPLSVK